MELMTGAEMFDGFERRLPIKKLDDATKSTAMERFVTYEKKGVIKGCSFEDDVWMLTDELRLVSLISGFHIRHMRRVPANGWDVRLHALGTI